MIKAVIILSWERNKLKAYNENDLNQLIFSIVLFLAANIIYTC